jgi:hypothetical protein
MNSSSKIYIRGSRQKRAVVALLENTSVGVKKLGLIIGACNRAQTISELRKQGFGDMIGTRRLCVTDRDGKICRPGEYFIPAEFRAVIERVLEEVAPKAGGIARGDKNAIDENHDNKRRDV